MAVSLRGLALRKKAEQRSHLLRRYQVAAIGGLLAIALGIAGLEFSMGRLLVQASYDLPFRWRPNLDPHGVTIVYLDAASAQKLNQPVEDVWSRALHVPLLDA
ncbi:MAG: hypothetical protein ABI217_04565 [Chthoniobacterales bacterium]